jgi:hypothetical protein
LLFGAVVEAKDGLFLAVGASEAFTGAFVGIPLFVESVTDGLIVLVRVVEISTAVGDVVVGNTVWKMVGALVERKVGSKDGVMVGAKVGSSVGAGVEGFPTLKMARKIILKPFEDYN